MAGYLDQYGAGEERREKILKVTLLALVALLIAGGVAYWFLKNYRQEQQAQRFFDLLARRDYQAAYTLWGCTEAEPCRDYPFSEFLKDWGPEGRNPRPESFRIARSRSCGSGVILTVDVGNNQEEKLWVERDDLTIGFSPWPGCPAGR
jgi:hypothetical protein